MGFDASELISRLESIGLSKYVDAFLEEGFEEWSFLMEMHEREIRDAAGWCKLDPEATETFVEYVLRFAGPLSTSEVLVDAPLTPSLDAVIEASRLLAMPSTRLAIACMTKRPVNIVSWLRHHRDRCGVSFFFLRVEETPELKDVLEQPEWKHTVRASFADGWTARDCGSGQCERQDAHVNWAIEGARQLGCTHLMHCDDDELFHCPAGAAAFHAALVRPPEPEGMRDPPSSGSGGGAAVGGVVELHVRVMEAYFPEFENSDPFASAVAFRHRPAECARYGWQRGSTGKSIGVLSVPGLVPAGPHHFQERAIEGVKPVGPVQDGFHRRFDLVATAVLPPSVCVLLHYESSSLSVWRQKYVEQYEHWRLRRKYAPPLPQLPPKPVLTAAQEEADDEENWQGVYFSRCNAAAAKLVEAVRRGDEAALAEAHEAAKRVWSKWKREPEGLPTLQPGERHRVLRDRGVTLINIAWPDPPVRDAPPSGAAGSTGAQAQQREVSSRDKHGPGASRVDPGSKSESDSPGARRDSVGAKLKQRLRSQTELLRGGGREKVQVS